LVKLDQEFTHTPENCIKTDHVYEHNGNLAKINQEFAGTPAISGKNTLI
jgi:hypothetical protein